jgi:hypothetical protein
MKVAPWMMTVLYRVNQERPGCPPPGDTRAQPCITIKIGKTMNLKALTVLFTLITPALAQPDPYTYYGGKIDAAGKNAAVEECEYQELVENQRCNERVNKTECIREVHAQCKERYAPVNVDGAEKEQEATGRDENN